MLSRFTLDVFNCQRIVSADGENPDDARYMGGQTDIECFEQGGTHLTLLPFAIIALIVYILMFPAFIGYLLWSNKELVKRDQLARARDEPETRERLGNDGYEFRKKYSRMYQFFKPGKWYWILVLFARKFALALTSLMFATVPSYQLAMSLLVLFIGYTLQTKHEPYMSPSDHQLVLEEHAIKARYSDIHAQIESQRREQQRRNRTRGAVSHASGWSAAVAQQQASHVVNSASLYFLSYNGLESTLLFCAVLLCLSGLMFESDRFSSDGVNTAERDTLTYLALLIIFCSIVYWLSVVFIEIFIVFQPEAAARCFNESDEQKKRREEKTMAGVKQGKSARKAATTKDGDFAMGAGTTAGMAPESGRAGDADAQTSFHNNPLVAKMSQ